MAIRATLDYTENISDNLNAPVFVTADWTEVINNEIPTQCRVTLDYTEVISEDSQYGFAASLGGLPASAPATGGISF
jgi:hypothetical protein